MVKTEAKAPASKHNTQKNNGSFFREGGALFADQQPEIQPFFKTNTTSKNGNDSGYFFNKPIVQPKLTIGQPGDRYEQEADNMADQVVQKLDTKSTPEILGKTNGQTSLSIQQLPVSKENKEEEKIQEKENKGFEEDNEIRRKPAFEGRVLPEDNPEIQKKCADCEQEENVQRKSDNTASSTSSLESRLSSSRGGGSPLPKDTRKDLENSFSADFSSVRIHTGSSAVQMNRELNAQAFTHGSDIYFNQGKFNTQNSNGKHLLAHELTHTIQQNAGIHSKTVQRQSGETNLERLNAMLDSFDVPEEDVISLCGELTADEKQTVLTGGYKDRMANALNVGEMVRAVNYLGYSLETKLSWVKASALFGTTFMEYSEIKAMVTAAPQSERDGLKTSTTAGVIFFVGVCTNETMVEALNDLQYDLVTKLTWLKAEMTITRWELDYATIQPWIIHANTTQTERDSLKTNTAVGKDFFVDVCTNATMIAALNDLQYDLVTKLTWLKAEMIITSWELDYATIQPWIIHANTTQTERDSLKTNTAVGKDFFVDVCTNATMVAALNDLQYDLVTKLTWLKAEMTITSWELNYITIKSWIIHPNTTQPERDALKTDPWKEFFINVCTNVTIIEAVNDLQFDLETKIEWVRTEAGLEEVKQVIELATQADRDVVWNDAAYLSTLRSEEGDDYYLWVIVKLRMLFVGTVSHTRAVDADAAIQTHLSAYVRSAITAGRQIEGFVAVVDTTNWNIAGEHHYGASVWATKNINGFVDSARRVWIEQNSGNPGTMVHEATHKYSSSELKDVSQPLNEGVTEYFTRLVCNADGINIAGRTNYQNNWTTATKLVALVGEAIVAGAYFDGDMDTLETTFVAAKSASDWTNFITETKNKNWAAADGYL